MKIKRCNFNQRPMSFAASEAGCPLDHCPCGTHDAEGEHHTCVEPSDEDEDPIRYEA